MKDLSDVLLAALVLATITVVGAKCPENSRGIVKKYQGYCYEFIKEKAFYPQAQKQCSQNGGHLVTIESKEKQAWLAKAISEDLLWVDGIWIGISRDEASWNKPSGHQLWYENKGKPDSRADPIAIKYHNWNFEEPDLDRSRNCAAMGLGTKFKWTAMRCNVGVHDYYIVCQYDGPRGFFSNPAVCVPVLIIVCLLVVAGAVLLYKCYKKRQQLEQRLHNENYDENIFTDYQINEKGDNTNEDDTKEDNTKFPLDNNNGPVNNTPSAYAPVFNLTPSGNSFHDFNIQTDPGYRREKLHQKDLSLKDISADTSLQHAEYNRSVSAPPGCQPVSPSAPSETCSIVMEEEDHISNVDERAPLHFQRTNSIESNSLSG